MTTVDTTPVPSGWIETVEERAAQSTVDTRRVLLAVLLFIPMLLGATVGLLVRAGIYAHAAAVEGYAIGRGTLARGGEDGGN